MAETADRSHGSRVVVVVALVGLLSTVGASALGGYWANKSVQREFESQRTAQIQDLRRQVYVDYLRMSALECDAKSTGPEAKAQKAAIDLLNLQAQILLIASPDSDLRDAVTKFTRALLFESGAKDACADNDTYLALRNVFIDSARQDLG